MELTSDFLIWGVLWVVACSAAILLLRRWAKDTPRGPSQSPPPREPPPSQSTYIWLFALVLLQYVSTFIFEAVGSLSDEERRKKLEVNTLYTPFTSTLTFFVTGIGAMVGADLHAGDAVEVAHLLQISFYGALLIGTISGVSLLILSYAYTDVLTLFIDPSLRESSRAYLNIKLLATPLIAIKLVSIGYFTGAQKLALWSKVLLFYLILGAFCYSFFEEFCQLGLLGKGISDLLAMSVWFVAVVQMIWMQVRRKRRDLPEWRPYSSNFVTGRAEAGANLCVYYIVCQAVESTLTQLQVHFTDKSRSAIIQGLHVLTKAEAMVEPWALFFTSAAILSLSQAVGASKQYYNRVQAASQSPPTVRTLDLGGVPTGSQDFKFHIKLLSKQVLAVSILMWCFFAAPSSSITNHKTPLTLFVHTYGNQGYQAEATFDDVQHAIRWLWYINIPLLIVKLVVRVLVAVLCVTHDFFFLRQIALLSALMGVVPAVVLSALYKDEVFTWVAVALFYLIQMGYALRRVFHHRLPNPATHYFTFRGIPNFISAVPESTGPPRVLPYDTHAQNLSSTDDRLALMGDDATPQLTPILNYNTQGSDMRQATPRKIVSYPTFVPVG